MKFIFPILALALFADVASAQCSTGARFTPVQTSVHVVKTVTTKTVQTTARVLVRPVVTVLRRAPLRTFAANVLFFPYR